MKKAILLLLTTAIVFLSNSCKKGEDDPLISLKTRKSRMDGTWTMTRGNVGLTSYASNTAPFNSNFEFTGEKGFLTETGTLIIYTLNYNLSLTFDKKGKFSLSENFNGVTLKSDGEWNFSSGVGDKKNKADVYLKLTEVSSGDTQEHLFNDFSTEICYRIKKLSDKELVLYTTTKLYMNLAGEKGVFKAEYTFKKQ